MHQTISTIGQKTTDSRVVANRTVFTEQSPEPEFNKNTTLNHMVHQLEQAMQCSDVEHPATKPRIFSEYPSAKIPNEFLTELFQKAGFKKNSEEF